MSWQFLVQGKKDTFTIIRNKKVPRKGHYTNPLGAFSFNYLGQTGQLISQQAGAVGTQWGYEDICKSPIITD